MVVANFARAVALLNSLLPKGDEKTLKPPIEEQLIAFKLKKKSLTGSLVLRLPKRGRTFPDDTDACGHQIGMALFQMYDDGEEYPVVFRNRT